MPGISKAIIYLTFLSGIFLNDVVLSDWKKIPQVTGSSCILSFENIILVGSDNGVYCSLDNALTWKHYSVDYPSKIVTDLTRNNEYIFAATNNGIYLSADTGKIWKYSGPSFSILSVYVADSVLFACINGGGLFRSENNGDQWTAIDGNHYYSYLVDDGKILAGTFTGIYESVDEGLTWNLKALPNKITTSISKNDNYFFAVNYSFGIFRSSDRGITWSEFNEGIPVDKIHPYTVFAVDSMIFAGLTSNKVYLSTNNGLMWKDFGEGININEDTYHVKFAVSGNKILVSFLYNSLWYCDLTEITGIAERNSNKVDNFVLYQNYPNPFNSGCKINYSLPKACFVTIKIYDLLGNEITTLVKGKKQAGNYQVTYKAINISSGVYFYRMQAVPESGEAWYFNDIKKIILLK